MQREEFEKLVAEAIDSLPDHIHEKIENVAIVIEDFATPEQSRRGNIAEGGLLLGLYEGVPQTKRGLGYNMALPDKITLFHGAIEKIARTPEQIKKQVRQTVWHEVAHYFGFDEEGIEKLQKNRP